jgi:cytochrome bd ubiquinol oxidase subunit II
METLWFMIVAVMVATYVVLDGFDLGAGVIYLGAAKTAFERRKIIGAIGPVWDGNEVWLLAAGGTLYFAFPLLYASSFSGFYLPLMMVLWLLMLRGIGIELRHHMHNPVWVGFFDVIFSVSSILLCIFFGAALGNVVRGVPLAANQYFFEPLWTNFRVNYGTGTLNGILDWYTVLTGVIALVTLTAHGSLYIAIKTENGLAHRARTAAMWAWPVQLLLTVVGLFATVSIRPGVLDNYRHHYIGFLIPVVVFAALAVVMHGMIRQSDKMAFVASAIYIVAMLVGAAFALYPVVLPASTDPALNLTIYNTAAGEHGLAVGFAWWSLGAILAFGYFFYLFRMFRGKVRLEGEGY